MLDHRRETGGGRTTDRRLRLLLAVPILLTVLDAALPQAGLAADADRAYAQGKRAAEEGQWLLAARLMVQAIDAEPVDKKRPFVGPYIPHFFLGRSLYELGDCDLAVEHLRRSRHFGVVVDTAQHPQLEEIEKSCKARSSALRRIRSDIETGYKLAGRVGESASDPQWAEFWNAGSPPPIATLRQAEQSLATADRLLESRSDLEVSEGRTLEIRPLTPDQLSTAGQMALQALARLRELEQSAEQHVRQAATRHQSLLNEVLGLRLEVVRAWDASSERARGHPRARDLESEYRRVTTLHLGDPAVTLDELQDVKSQLAEFLADLDQLPPIRTQQAPASLRLAAQAYFAGRYDQVLSVLDDVTFSERPAQAHFHLFRAAAQYALYLIGDPPDPDLLRAAQSSVHSCLEASASLEPLTEAFSPRFVQFFREMASSRRQGP